MTVFNKLRDQSRKLSHGLTKQRAKNNDTSVMEGKNALSKALFKATTTAAIKITGLYEAKHKLPALDFSHMNRC